MAGTLPPDPEEPDVSKRPGQEDDRSPDGPDGPGESRWPVLIAMAIAVALPLFLPERFTPGPRWLLPVIEAAFLIAIAVGDPGRIDRRSRAVREVRRTFIVLLVLGAAWATAALTHDLLHGGPETNSATALLRAGAIVWLDTVLAFAFLFWELDGGGPGERAHEPAEYPDLAFPEQMNPLVAPPGWRPVLLDYLYLGLTNALAFSPTDVMPLARWAKAAMGLQSVISLLILGLVIARAVNILK
jgi:uncharacterized membrane protein